MALCHFPVLVQDEQFGLCCENTKIIKLTSAGRMFFGLPDTFPSAYFISEQLLQGPGIVIKPQTYNAVFIMVVKVELDRWNEVKAGRNLGRLLYDYFK